MIKFNVPKKQVFMLIRLYISDQVHLELWCAKLAVSIISFSNKLLTWIRATSSTMSFRVYKYIYSSLNIILNMDTFNLNCLLLFRGIPCAIITVFYAPFPGRSHTRRQRPSRLWTHLLPRWHQKRTNLNLVGVEFGRHGAAVDVELSSAWLVRVSDEPAVGTTDYCCTFTAKGRKKDRAHARDEFIITLVSREYYVIEQPGSRTSNAHCDSDVL